MNILTRAKLLTIAVFATAMAGCATNYDAYVQANVKVAEAKAKADTEKYKAMAAIASTGDAAAKVAAVMSIAMGSHNQPHVSHAIAAPKSAAEMTMQAIANVLPSIAQIYGINRQTALGVEQVRSNVAIQQAVSNASVMNTASTNNAFSTIAGKIQSNITTTTTTTTDSTHTPTVIKVDPIVVRPEVVKPAVVNLTE